MLVISFALIYSFLSSIAAYESFVGVIEYPYQQAYGVVGAGVGSQCAPANNMPCAPGLVCEWATCFMNYWDQLDFSAGWQGWNIIKQYNSQNRVLGQFPSLQNFGNDVVLSVKYPAGSYVPSSSSPGGTGIFAAPLDLSKATRISLEYQVYFPSGYNFVKGGKLPGLYGGHDSCTGGNAATDCFSTRLMWRQGGIGEVYLYIPKAAQTSSFCTVSTKCVNNQGFAFSYGRGTFKFETGQWNTVRQLIKINSVSNGQYQNNGVLRLWINGAQVLESSIIAYRTSSSVLPIGIDFETFFGGDDKSFATPVEQKAYFKRIRLGSYYTGDQ